MRRLLIASFLLLPLAAAAQSTTTIDDLKTPPSPAFVLMGIAPSAVQEPTTPKALGASLLSAVDDSNASATPRNFALEFAPYWMTNHPDLTYDKFNEADFGQALLQSLSVSLATTQQTAATSTTPASTLGGLGIRASWLIGKPSAVEGQIRDAIKQATTTAAVNMGAPVPGATAAPLISSNTNLTNLIESLRSARYEGRWYVEAAAATTALFSGNDADHSAHQKNGFWLTPSYRLSRTTFNATTGTSSSQPNIDLLGVVRWISDHTGTTISQPLDLGARLIWNSGSVSVSAEHLQRRHTSNNSSRTAAIGNFKINDNLYVTATFGKNFADETPNGNLIGILGLHFGIGSQPLSLTQ